MASLATSARFPDFLNNEQISQSGSEQWSES
jgi:hypothetical protein